MKTRSLLAALMMVTLAGPVLAQQRTAPLAPAAPRPAASPANQPPPPAPPQMVTMQDDGGARDTRDWFRKVLDQYPPSVRDVLRIDTSLLSRPDYLATYPALAAFLEQHPEVAHNPAYFVGTPDSREDGPQAATMEVIRGWRDAAQFLGVIAIVFIITSALAGVIKTLIDQHRWQRAARMHMEIQNKLLDRFASSNELLAYLETPTGRGLADLQLPGLGSAALRQTDGPASRIFWPMQAGIVLAFAGIGLAYMGPRMGLYQMSQPLTGFGALVGAVGLGFIVSAIASFFLSHRLGLVPTATRGTHDA